MQKTHPKMRSLKRGVGLVAVLLVVLVAADHPIPGLEGLLATGEVLLRDERSFILGDFHQVRFTNLDCRGYSGEASASGKLLAGRLRRTLVRICLAHIKTRAIRIGGCSGAVSTDEVRTTGVTFLDGGFRQTTLYVIDTGSVFNFSHKSEFF